MISTVPTTNQMGYLEHIGVKAGDLLESFSADAIFPMALPTLGALQARKEQFKADVIASGETPALQLPSGELVSESEIVCECLLRAILYTRHSTFCLGLQ